MKKNRPLLKGAAILTFASILSRILGFLYRIFLSNILGAEGMGIFQLIFPIFTLCVSVSSGGIQIAVSRFVAERNKNKVKCLGVLRASIIMSGILSILLAAILYLFSAEIALFALKDIRCAGMLKFISIAVPMAAFHSCVTGYYLGVQNTVVPAFAQILEQVFKIASLFVITMVYAGNGYSFTAVQAVISVVISEIAGSLFLLAAIYTTRLSVIGRRFSSASFSGIRKKLQNTFEDIKQLFSVAYILTLNKIMLTFLQSVEAIIIPIVLTKYGLSKTDSLSVYGILTGMALPVISFPSALITSLSMVIMPSIAEANAYGKSVSMKHTTTISTQVSCVCGIFCLGVFIFFGDFIGIKIFGHELAGKYICNLAWLCPFLYLSITFGSILHGLGKTTDAFVHNLISVIIRILFLWFIVPEIGITGYFWGLLISTLITTFLHAHVISSTIEFHFSSYECIIKPALWLFISLGAGILLKDILNLILYNLALSGLLFDIFSAALSGALITAIFGFFLYQSFRRM